MIGGLAPEEIKHKDLVLVGGIGIGQKIRALFGLWAETEDVIIEENASSGG